MFEPKHILKYDSTVKECSFEGENQNVGALYTSYKKVQLISSRDFYQKCIRFYHDGKYYNFSSSFESGKLATKKDTVRGEYLINFGILKQTPSGVESIQFVQ